MAINEESHMPPEVCPRVFDAELSTSRTVSYMVIYQRKPPTPQRVELWAQPKNPKRKKVRSRPKRVKEKQTTRPGAREPDNQPTKQTTSQPGGPKSSQTTRQETSGPPGQQDPGHNRKQASVKEEKPVDWRPAAVSKQSRKQQGRRQWRMPFTPKNRASIAAHPLGVQ